MFISHDPKFVFLEVPRTGSRSISKLCQTISKRGRQYPHHTFELPAGRDWTGYYMFAMVRNPFVRELSHYLHRRSHPKNNYHDIASTHSFRGYLEKLINVEPCQVRMLAGLPLNNLVWFEDGGPDKLMRSLPFMPVDAKLPHLNRNDPYLLTDHYDEHSARLVLDHADLDFEHLGYDRDSWMSTNLAGFGA